MRIFLAVLLLVGLAACGKKGAPRAPGPPDEIIYPRAYPTH
jgi:predicted small lipoprotein YifL